MHKKRRLWYKVAQNQEYEYTLDRVVFVCPRLWRGEIWGGCRIRVRADLNVPPRATAIRPLRCTPTSMRRLPPCRCPLFVVHRPRHHMRQRCCYECSALVRYVVAMSHASMPACAATTSRRHVQHAFAVMPRCVLPTRCRVVTMSSFAAKRVTGQWGINGVCCGS